MERTRGGSRSATAPDLGEQERLGSRGACSRYLLTRGDLLLSTTPRNRKKRTHLWFGVYTAVVLAVFALSLVKQQWSVAVTALLIAVVFAFATRWLWRRR